MSYAGPLVDERRFFRCTRVHLDRGIPGPLALVIVRQCPHTAENGAWDSRSPVCIAHSCLVNTARPNGTLLEMAALEVSLDPFVDTPRWRRAQPRQMCIDP